MENGKGEEPEPEPAAAHLVPVLGDNACACMHLR